MKTFLIIFLSFTVLATITAFAYNSGKGPAKQRDGITELPKPALDSVIKRGKDLVSKLNYSTADLNAITTYLNNR